MVVLLSPFYNIVTKNGHVLFKYAFFARKPLYGKELEK